jgi:hypothetical protein
VFFKTTLSRARGTKTGFSSYYYLFISEIAEENIVALQKTVTSTRRKLRKEGDFVIPIFYNYCLGFQLKVTQNGREWVTQFILVGKAVIKRAFAELNPG